MKKIIIINPEIIGMTNMTNTCVAEGESVEVIALNTHTRACEELTHLEEKITSLAHEKGFTCKVTNVQVDCTGDVNSLVKVFRKLLDYLNDGDVLCADLGDNPGLAIALYMAVQYAYRLKKNVSIGCLVYGETDHSVEPEMPRIFDITALIHLDELVRQLAENKVEKPLEVIDTVIEMANAEDDADDGDDD